MEKKFGLEGQPSKLGREEKKNKKHLTSNGGESFNWALPFLGAVGFGAGFALSCAISATSLNIAQNAFADVIPGIGIGLETGLLRGVIVGSLGGAALGLAYKNKNQVLYFSFTGAVGFAIAFVFVLSLDSIVISDLGSTIIRFIGAPDILSPFERVIAHGLGIGAIVGALGGLILGIAAVRGNIFASFLLAFTGAVWFANAFAIDAANSTGANCGTWNSQGGAIGGAIFGLVLALYDWFYDKFPLRWSRSIT